MKRGRELGNILRYRRETSYLEHFPVLESAHSSRLTLPHFRSRTVLETLFWVTPSSKRGSQFLHSQVQQPLGTGGDRVHGRNRNGGATLFVPSVYRYAP